MTIEIGQQLHPPQQDVRRHCQRRQRNAAAGKALQPSGDHAQIQAELHDLRRQNKIVGQGINMPRTSDKGLRRALQNGYPHRRHQPHAQEGQLETGSEQDLRIHDHEAERRRANGVQHRLLAIEQPRPQIESQHQRGSPNRRSQRGQQGVSHHQRNRDRACKKIADPHPPQEPERYQRQNAHVHPRNHQHVIGARALKVGTGWAVDESVFTDHHGVHKRGFLRRPQGMDFVDDAAVDSGAPEFRPVTGKARKNFNAFGLGRGQGHDPVFREISAVVEGARVAIIAWRRNLRGKPETLSIAEPACLAVILIRLDLSLPAGMPRTH